jgi:hypothetical protein
MAYRTGVNIARKHIGWFHCEACMGRRHAATVFNQHGGYPVQARQMLHAFFEPWLEKQAALRKPT